jgi:hypothetical protein
METIRREIFAPDLVWNLPGRHPLAGTKQGADEVLAFFSQLVKAGIQVTLDPAADPNTGVDTFGESTVVEVHRGHGTTSVRDASGNESQVALNAYNCTLTSRTDGLPGCRFILAPVCGGQLLRGCDINPSQTTGGIRDIWHRSPGIG